MKYRNLQNISFHEIQIFLKVVELGSYTLVADYFNFSVSKISKTISTLEENLGLILFIRKSKGICPTPAARMLAGEWSSMINSLEQSVEKAHTVQTGKVTSIRMGYIEASEKADRRLRQVLDEFEKKHQRIEVRVEKYDLHELVEKLNLGSLDLMITAYHEIPSLEAYKLPWKVLFESPHVVYYSKNSELFGKEDLQFQDFRFEKFIILSPLEHANYHVFFDTFCMRYGFRPKVEMTVPNVSTMYYNLCAGKGCVLADAATYDWAENDNVRMLELLEKSQTLVCWKRSTSKEVLELITWLCDAYGKAWRLGMEN